jgi:hypothetical protein
MSDPDALALGPAEAAVGDDAGEGEGEAVAEAGPGHAAEPASEGAGEVDLRSSGSGAAAPEPGVPMAVEAAPAELPPTAPAEPPAQGADEHRFEGAHLDEALQAAVIAASLEKLGISGSQDKLEVSGSHDRPEVSGSHDKLEVSGSHDRPEPMSAPRVDPPAPEPVSASHPHADEAPPASISGRRAEDGGDMSSVSAEFFRGDEDSVPPLVDTVGDDHQDEPPPPSEVNPAALARRARLRRIVGAVVGFAGVVAVAAVGKAIFVKPSQHAPQPVAAVTAPAPTKQEAPPEAKPAPAPEAKPAPAPEAKPAEPAAADTAKPAEPKPEEKAALDAADIAKLKKEALSYLNQGRYKQAIETARAAIAADPDDAMMYLYLGSALQDSGKWKEGIEAYSDCVRTAKKGPVHECAAMGGRK